MNHRRNSPRSTEQIERRDAVPQNLDDVERVRDEVGLAEGGLEAGVWEAAENANHDAEENGSHTPLDSSLVLNRCEDWRR